MTTNRFYYVALMIVAAIFGYFTYEILRPFLSPIGWAMVFSIVFYPVYAFFLKYLKWKPAASLLTLILILLAILGPFSYLSYLLTQEVESLLDYVNSGTFDPFHAILRYPLASDLLSRILALFNMTETQLQKTITDSLSQLGKQSVTVVGSGLGNVASVVFDFVLMIVAVFFFLADGPDYLEKAERYLPFSKKQREKLITETRDIVISTIYGGVTVAVVQGAIGGIAFAVLGIHGSVVWGMSMFIASFIPVVGTSLIWGPAALYLLFQGLVAKAITLLVVGAVIISSVDNVLRPLIIGGKMKMPTLVIFLSILGGLKVFGFIGFIMGPLVIALFVSIAEIIRYIGEDQSD
jgi:predicted PurR-regulated permease PerM